MVKSQFHKPSVVYQDTCSITLINNNNMVYNIVVLFMTKMRYQLSKMLTLTFHSKRRMGMFTLKREINVFYDIQTVTETEENLYLSDKTANS